MSECLLNVLEMKRLVGACRSGILRVSREIGWEDGFVGVDVERLMPSRCDDEVMRLKLRSEKQFSRHVCL